MQRYLYSTHHVPERDTFLGSRGGAEGESGDTLLGSRGGAEGGSDEREELLLSHFEMVSYFDVDTGQQEEFQYLLKRVLWSCVWCACLCVCFCLCM